MRHCDINKVIDVKILHRPFSAILVPFRLILALLVIFAPFSGGKVKAAAKKNNSEKVVKKMKGDFV